MSDKKVTPLKIKMTHRKQGNSKSKISCNVAPSDTTDESTKLHVGPDNTKINTHGTMQKSKKRSRKSTSKILPNDSEKNNSKSTKAATQNNHKNRLDTTIVLRNEVSSTSASTRNVKNEGKRFSDTFVVENGRNVKKPNDTVDGVIPHSDKSRKSRRFSDLFRTSRTISGSVEDFKLVSESILSRQNSEVCLKSSLKNDMAKSAEKEVHSKEIPNSYLKRVKSKIYRSNKNEAPNDQKGTKSTKSRDSGIPEECELGQGIFDSNFRLFRQNSNLEGTWTQRNHSDGVDSRFKKLGILEKSKSSSAINLNLLRTRRNKIMEQVRKRNCQEVKNEFEFVGFGPALNPVKNLSSSQILVGDTSNKLPPSWIQEAIGESKPCQPASRTESDRRPDCINEKNGRRKQNTDSAVVSLDVTRDKNEEVSPESAVSHPLSSNKRRITSNITRSESVKEQSEKQRKQRRNISDPSQNTSGIPNFEQVDLSNTVDTGSSSNSNSSISFNGRVLESPTNSKDNSHGNKSEGESDMDADSDHIDWQDLISIEQLNNLPPHEKKRQDVINELFYTEKSHLRSLNVLHKIFFKPLQKSQVLKPEELSLIFPNIEELLQIHRQFNHEMTRKRREDPIVRNLGDLLLNMFSGDTGETFRKAASKFCERQQLALELIKERRKRDSKFESLLAEGEKKRQCRRLQLQAILPVEMQRLSKLPLLLERLIGALQEGGGNEEELNKLNRAYHLSKEIVNHVNEATKMALNQARLEEIQRHLDQSNFERSNDPISQEFRPLDLTKYRLVREGPMHLRRPNKSSVLVHVLLMEEVVVILHKEGDRYVLKNFQSGTSGQTNPLSPIIKISTLLVRINAVCKNALFLVNTSTMNSQMYDLRAEDDAKRDVWFKHFSDVTDAHNKKEGKTRLSSSLPDDDCEEESIQEFFHTQDVSGRAEEVDHGKIEESFVTSASDIGCSANSSNDNSSDNEENSPKIEEEPDSNPGLSRVTAEEWPLVQPSQVHVVILPIHQAESRVTPIERIRRKHEEVKRALTEYENLIADHLSVPQQDFNTIADMVSEEESSSDLINLTMASIYQTNRLQKIINDTLNLSAEGDFIKETGGRNISCKSQMTDQCKKSPSIPVSQVQHVVNKISKHLIEILDKQKQLEDENSLMRIELFKMREKLHEHLSIHDSSGSSFVLPDATSELVNDEEVDPDSKPEES